MNTVSHFKTLLAHGTEVLKHYPSENKNVVGTFSQVIPYTIRNIHQKSNKRLRLLNMDIEMVCGAFMHKTEKQVSEVSTHGMIFYSEIT